MVCRSDVLVVIDLFCFFIIVVYVFVFSLFCIFLSFSSLCLIASLFFPVLFISLVYLDVCVHLFVSLREGLTLHTVHRMKQKGHCAGKISSKGLKNSLSSKIENKPRLAYVLFVDW